MTRVDRHSVGPEQLTNTIGESLDDRVLALQDGRVIEADVVGQDAEIGAVLHGLQHVGGAQHGLGGNAAPVQAHAARALLLDERHAQPVLCGPNRRGVAARPTADDDDVECALLGHLSYQLSAISFQVSVYEIACGSAARLRAAESLLTDDS